jgi:hypothetical protein
VGRFELSARLSLLASLDVGKHRLNALTLKSYTMLLLSWLCLIGLPPLALGIYRFIRHHRQGAQWPIGLVCIAILITTIFAFRLGFSLAAAKANVGWLWICYLAYCLLAAFCLAINKRWLRAAALTITAIPILLGYALATIGVIGFFWILGDVLTESPRTQVLEDGLICKIDEWGSAVTDSGYTVRLYSSWPAVPFLQREVARESVNFNKTNDDISCEALVAKLKRLP